MHHVVHPSINRDLKESEPWLRNKVFGTGLAWGLRSEHTTHESEFGLVIGWLPDNFLRPNTFVPPRHQEMKGNYEL